MPRRNAVRRDAKPAMNKNPLRHHLQRNQVAFLDTQSEINGHCFSDGAVQIIVASDLCFTSLQLSRDNAEKLRDILDRLLSR
jgi:hypothetical protein